MALSLASYYERRQIYKVSPKFILIPWFGPGDVELDFICFLAKPASRVTPAGHFAE